ncbi:hypothetical protein NGM37_47115, partial [Streptomyces sp. TRM76130]|nr:hypothetical protein [Streptomyces sp. TRM76130]
FQGDDGTHFYTRGEVVTARPADSSETPAGVDLVFPRAHWRPASPRALIASTAWRAYGPAPAPSPTWS